jgi:hypothetical protein
MRIGILRAAAVSTWIVGDEPSGRRFGRRCRPPRHLGRAEVLDRRHKHAANRIFELLAFLSATFRQERLERCQEQFLETLPGHDGKALQQVLRPSVQCKHAAIAIGRDQPGAQRMHVFAPAMERNEQVALVVSAKQAVFDLRRSHGHKSLRMVLS